MISSRALLFSFLSIACVGTFLYYTLLPQGPHLLRWTQPSTEELEPLVPEPDTQDESASELEHQPRPEVEDGPASSPASILSQASKADKFTPEYGSLCIRLSDRQADSYTAESYSPPLGGALLIRMPMVPWPPIQQQPIPLNHTRRLPRFPSWI